MRRDCARKRRDNEFSTGGTYAREVGSYDMTQDQKPRSPMPSPPDDRRQEPLAEALEEAAPPFNLPPLPKSRRAEIRVPASINGRDLSKGEP